MGKSFPFQSLRASIGENVVKKGKGGGGGETLSLSLESEKRDAGKEREEKASSIPTNKQTD